MAEFFYRTEDIPPKEIIKFFAETEKDRSIIDVLKNRTPAVLVGSRGVGKSFLLKIAQIELLSTFENDRSFPVYVSFQRSSLIRGEDPDRFQHWMLAKLCSAVLRALEKEGMFGRVPKGASLIAGSEVAANLPNTKIEEIAKQYEGSYRDPELAIDRTAIPSVEEFKDAIEDLAEDLDISRFNFLIDEAAHIFLPAQQRQFFTLFRDLRSHCLICNAAVYPGVTSFGETFQPSHDATMIEIDRDVLDQGYISHMREIVEKQADAATQRNIIQNGQNFATLAYAASGNPRLLLKTLADAPSVVSSELNETIRKFYRTNIWSEHSDLAERYVGHKAVIDWGRQFVETTILPEIKNKNDNYLSSDRNTSCFFWVHRNAPEGVKEALRILSYTGIVKALESGIKATRGEVGKRYAVNLGCLFGLEATPASSAFAIARNLTPKRMTEYGSNHVAFVAMKSLDEGILEAEEGFALEPQFAKPIRVLDLTHWQKEKLESLEIKTVGEVLEASEDDLKKGYYVGDVRARTMKNAAYAAVLEYLSG
ncbi:MAG: hypothetical protein WA908_00600 [Pontixanthobacter sp.]